MQAKTCGKIRKCECASDRETCVSVIYLVPECFLFITAMTALAFVSILASDTLIIKSMPSAARRRQWYCNSNVSKCWCSVLHIISLSPWTFISRIFISGLFLICPCRISLSSQGLRWDSFISLICHSMYHFLSSLYAHPHFLGIVSPSNSNYLSQARFWDLGITSSHAVLNQAHVLHVLHVSVAFIRSYMTLSSQPNFPVPFSLVSGNRCFVCQTHFDIHFSVVFPVSSQTLVDKKKTNNI